MGTHIARYGPEGVKHFFIGLFVCEIFYTLTLCFTKFSILFFYWRIFGKTNIQIPAAVLGSIVTGWGIAVVSPRPLPFPVEDDLRGNRRRW